MDDPFGLRQSAGLDQQSCSTLSLVSARMGDRRGMLPAWSSINLFYLYRQAH